MALFSASSRARFPWRTTWHVLRTRFHEDRLGAAAGSLTFTTVISLVPLLTVGLAIFSAFPVFSRLEATLQKWLLQSLVPDHIARQVSNYLLQFASKAGQIGWVGALFLLLTALAMVLTIDRKLNEIWRVRTPRPLGQRLLVYWASLTLGPLLLAVSLTLSSYAVSASRGWVSAVPGGLWLALNITEFAVVVLGVAALYRYVPNARVRFSHALLGGLLVALGLEGAKNLLGWYLALVPTYSVVYGTFATVPIFLVWIHLVWMIVLLGAVVVACLPTLQEGVERQGGSPGWTLQLALEVLAELHTLQDEPERGLDTGVLLARLRVDPQQLADALAALQALDWVGQLAEEQGRHVLLVRLAHTPLSPLLQHCLLAQTPATQALWHRSHWHQLHVADVLPGADTADTAAAPGADVAPDLHHLGALSPLA